MHPDDPEKSHDEVLHATASRAFGPARRSRPSRQIAVVALFDGSNSLGQFGGEPCVSAAREGARNLFGVARSGPRSSSRCSRMGLTDAVLGGDGAGGRRKRWGGDGRLGRWRVSDLHRLELFGVDAEFLDGGRDFWSGPFAVEAQAV